NPISAGLVIPGIPDHSFVTIVGITAGTTVTIKLGGAIVGGAGIPAGKQGDVVTQTIGPFDVINLESTGIPGDMTGTIVESSAPIVVFTGGERGIAPLTDGPPAPPGYDKSMLCCTDHLEEQLLPVTSYGKDFVITRSPSRSTSTGGSYIEPDLLRFMGVAAPATVKTSLPPPDDSFTLMPGQTHDAWTTTDFVATSTEPVAIAQILVSQTFTADYTGDPSLTIFPPVDQYRRDYLFNVPTSYDSSYVVIAAPIGAKVSVDSAAPADCVVAPAGNVGGKDWEARRCKLAAGPHRMHGDAPFGIVAYGYGSRASYAFVGGANVKKIYTPPPLN
ncbi:MAG TPA: IgGFc-binding protein, partial [Labilithrix sp.]